MAKRVYATISLLTRSRGLRNRVCRLLPAAGRRFSEQQGLFGLHFSTRERVDSIDLKVHFDLLLRDYRKLPVLLNNLPADTELDGLEVRLWIFFEADRANEDFALPAALVAWLSAMDADVCVDVWQ